MIGVREELFDLGTVRYVTKMLGSDAKTAAPKARQLQKKSRPFSVHKICKYVRKIEPEFNVLDLASATYEWWE